MGDVNTRAWREWLRDRVRLITEETTSETTIEFDRLGKVGSWVTAFIKTKSWRTIVAASDGVVKDDGVGSIIPTNSNAIKCLRAWVLDRSSALSVSWLKYPTEKSSNHVRGSGLTL